MAEMQWTIKELLNWTSDFFQQKGAERSRLDAEVLLAEAVGCRRIDLYTRFDEVVDESVRGVYRDWVRRHAAGEPVAYLVGHCEFFSLDFEVNSSVLIPRPETEHLVTETMDIIAAEFAGEEPVRIAEVGVGSGCVSVAIAHQTPRAQINAVDISGPALEVARRNCDRHQVADRVELLEGSLLGPLADCRELQIVVSNPPYIGESERDSIPTEVKDYEPESALFVSGPHGWQLSEELLDQVTQRCRSGVWVIIETSPIISEQLLAAVQARPFTKTQLKRDLAGHNRVLITQLQ